VQRQHRELRNMRHEARNLNRWRHAYRAHQRYHATHYHAPRGWYHRHWTYGQRLPRSWWYSRYWINDWSRFGLIAPPLGYVWVRVGPDAILVNRYTGVILRVIYDLYY
jgi:Ni/Co efflux regulator RcnB